MLNKTANYLKYIISIFIYEIIILMFFRILFFIIFYKSSNNIVFTDILYAFFNRGLLYDIYVSSYIVVIPYIILTMVFMLNGSYSFFNKVLKVYILFLTLICILICSANIPYYHYLHNYISKDIFSWGMGFDVMRVIISNPMYIIFFIIFCLISLFSYKVITRIGDKYLTDKENMRYNFFLKVVIFLFSSFLLLNGLRGNYRFDKSPLTGEDIFFSKNVFLNHLGYNPVFSFFDSYVKEDVRILSDDEAIIKAYKFFNIKDNKNKHYVRRDIKNVGMPLMKNIIIIMIESLTKSKMSYYGYKYNTTPFLDSLILKSKSFHNIYSSSIHTHDGIFATFYGLFSPFSEKTLNSTRNINYYGLPNILKDNGYSNYFFCGGDIMFDNMKFFLGNNGFDYVLGEQDFKGYSPENNWGLKDEDLYEVVLKSIDTIYKKRVPFFINILTVSTHKYSNYPKTNVKPLFSNIEDNLYYYADRSLEYFFKKAGNKEWFNNTVFIIEGDHGQAFDSDYDIPLSYHTIPLIFYGLGEGNNYNLGSQVDITATILSLLNFSYTDLTLGIDLNKLSRDVVPFTAENGYAYLDRENNYMVLYKKNGIKKTYNIKHKKLITDEGITFKIDSIVNSHLLWEIDLSRIIMKKGY